MILTNDLIRALEEEPALAMLVSQPPIAFHRSFVDITGSAMSALMLSTFLELQEHAPHTDGWFAYDPHAVKTTTGLSRNEQKAANKVLREKLILLERRNTTSWLTSTTLTARRQLSWPVEAGNEFNPLFA